MGKKTAGRALAISAAAAAAAGYVAGILTAPKSGKETRKDIQVAALKAKSESEKKLKAMHSELDDLIEQAKQKLSDVSDKARVELNAAVDTATNAKEKAREILSAVHEGDADDKELKKAVTEATKAADHLRVYLSKKSKSA